VERSAEFYRGEVAALNRAQRDFTITVPELQAEDVALLAEAEAREASVPTAAEVIAAAERALGPICADADEARRCVKQGWVPADQHITNRVTFGDVIRAADTLAAIAKWKEAQ
jgi:hypothetical protein